MSRTEWIYEMIKEGKPEAEIIAAIIKGNAMKGVKGMEGVNVETFAKLNYKKALKKLQGKK